MRIVLGVLLMVPSLLFAQQLTLTWDNVTGETLFRIERKAEICAGPGAFTEIATVGQDVLTYVFTVGTPGQFYCFRVRATNPTETSGYSNLAGKVFPFPPVGTPANLQVQ